MMGRYLATSKDNVPIASSVLKLEVLLMLIAFFLLKLLITLWESRVTNRWVLIADAWSIKVGKHLESQMSESCGWDEWINSLEQSAFLSDNAKKSIFNPSAKIQICTSLPPVWSNHQHTIHMDLSWARPFQFHSTGQKGGRLCPQTYSLSVALEWSHLIHNFCWHKNEWGLHVRMLRVYCILRETGEMLAWWGSSC